MKILLPAAVLLAATLPLFGATAPSPRFEFRLEILENEKPIGECTVRLEPQAEGGSRLTTTGRIETGGREIEIRSENLVDERFDWIRVESRFGPVAAPEMKASADRTGPTAGRLAATEKGKAPRSREILVDGDSVVLENHVFGDYAILLARIPLSTLQVKGTIVVPSSQEALGGGATRRALEAGFLDGRPIDVELWDVQFGNSISQIRRSFDVPGQLLEVVAGKTGFSAIRPGFKRGDRRAEIPKILRPATVSEIELPFEGTAGWPLVATLSLPPVRTERIAAVVLIPDSGPLDKDGTVDQMAFGRDFAWGMAEQGIAVVRWQKRSRTHAAKIASVPLTLEADLSADAVAACRLALAREEIDPAKVFVAGHGLGGFALPEVIRKVDAVAGAILLGAPSRPIDVVAQAREEYLARAFSIPVSEADARTRVLREAFARIRSGAAKPNEVLFGAPASWWTDLLSRSPATTLAADPRPVLALRGTKDFESRPEDMAGWREAAQKAGKENFRGGPVPGANHHFVPVPHGNSDGRDYQTAGRIDPQLVRMVADWIRRGGRLDDDARR